MAQYQLLSYELLPVNDETALRGIADSLGAAFGEVSSVTFRLTSEQSGVQHTYDSKSEDAASGLPMAGKSHFVGWAQAIATGPANTSIRLTYDRRVRAGFDQITVVAIGSDQHPKIPLKDATLVANSLASMLPPTDWQVTMRGLLGDKHAALEAQRARDLDSLRDFTEKIAQETGSLFVKREAEYLDRVRRLEKESDETETRLHELHMQRIAQLDRQMDIDRARLQANYDAKLADLQKREADLATQVRELDDRDAKHARRGIRSEMKQAFKSGGWAKLTDDTKKMRLPLHALFITLSTIFLSGSLWTATHVPDQADGVVLGWSLVRSALLGLAFGTTALFYIRWLNNWFERHAAEELRLKRLELDIDRASWVVETMLDASSEGEGRVTPELIDRLTRGLFAEQAAPAAAQHPVDQLATLLRAAANIDVQLPGGSKIGFDKKGLSNANEAK